MTTKQLEPIARAIDAHLQRFETDPVINAEIHSGGMRLLPYFHAHAVASRKRVCVQYVSYQGDSDLTAQQAVAYLAWLDAGNVGTHRAMPAVPSS